MKQSNSITITYEQDDEIIHTQDHPFCSDMTCPCRSDPELVDQLTQEWLDGLRSTGETFAVYWNQEQS